jgi:hypothetical protein
VSDAESFESGVFFERAGDGGRAEFVHEIEPLAYGGEIFLPELEEKIVDRMVERRLGLGVVLGVGLLGGGLLHRLWWRLVLPAEDFGDLLGKSEGIEGFEKDAGEPESGEAALIDSLDLGGQQEYGNAGDGRVLLHGAEGGGAVDSRHHDVHEDGVGLLGCGDGDAFGA